MTGPEFIEYRICALGDVGAYAHFDMLVCEDFEMFFLKHLIQAATSAKSFKNLHFCTILLNIMSHFCTILQTTFSFVLMTSLCFAIASLVKYFKVQYIGAI